MNYIELRLMTHYLTFLSSTCSKPGISRTELKCPNSEVLELLLDSFLKFSYEHAKHLCKSRIEDMYKLHLDFDEKSIIKYEQEKIIAEAIQSASIYMYLNLGTSEESMLNIIFKSSIDDLVRQFFDKEVFTYSIFEEYIKFLVDEYFGFIKESTKDDIVKKVPAIANIPNNKGFISINDISRKVLLDVYTELRASGLKGEELDNAIDEYFGNYKMASIIKKYASGIVKDIHEIMGFKAYQERIIIADSFLILTSAYNLSEIGLDDADSEILRTLTERIYQGYYGLPEDLGLRHSVYRLFFSNLLADIPHDYMGDSLKESGDAKMLRLVNPLFFLD